MIIYVSLALASIIPLGFLGLARWFDKYKTGKYKFNLVTLLWGAIAYFLAAQINPWMVESGLFSRNTVITVTGPIVEEILKSIVLIYLVSRAEFNFIVDGAIYGFGAGVGFAVFENWEYIHGNPEIAMSIAISRVFSTNLIHAVGSGLIGTVLGYTRFDKKWTKWLVVLSGYASAMGIHMIFNTVVSRGTFLIVAIIFGFAGLGLIWLVIQRGLNLQRQWMTEKGNEADRITKSEGKALSKIEQIEQEILAPVRERFGEDSAKIVKKMMLVNAEIRIKRKILDSETNEKRRVEVETIIRDLQNEVDGMRKELGSYCMMMVREVYLDQDLQLWGMLNTRIAASGAGQKGGGLWDLTSAKIKASKLEDEGNHEQ